MTDPGAAPEDGTLLHHACAEGHVAALEELVATYEAINFEHAIGLYRAAAKHGKANVLTTLLTHSSPCTGPSDLRKAALAPAIRSHSIDSVRCLVQALCPDLSGDARVFDEVDSVLIDEARTPLIISGSSDKTNNTYTVINKIINKFLSGNNTDYYNLEEKQK